MIVSSVQRWRARRDSYRPAGEPIVTRLYEVAPILDDRTAKAFVLEHHYEHRYPAALERFGLYRGGELVGVTVFSQPANGLVLELAPGDRRAELGRLVLLDEVPANGESFFIARCFELLRSDGYEGVVSYSDPMPRLTRDGRTVFAGHIGTVYQATNGTYLGLSPAHTVRLADDGSVIGNRTLSKIRSRERGWRYAVAQLVALGAREPTGDLREWLRAELPRISRPVRSQGKHRYVWAIDRRLRRHLPKSLAYPKVSRAHAGAT